MLQPPRFKLQLGGFITQLNSEVRLTSQTLGLGTRIDLENDAGLACHLAVTRFDGCLRLFRLEFNRTAGAHLKRDIRFGNFIFPAGSGVDAFSSGKTCKISYAFH
ncbi:MAG: hypothetical protein Q9M29_06750 [Mariprofundaceae bacterium]|nr:hypothetical protein [Mariprofundaceae bacterium]